MISIPSFALAALRRWRLIGLGLLVLALGVQTWRLSAAKGDVREARSEVSRVRGQIELQNQAIENLRREGAGRATAADRAIAEARRSASRAGQVADRISRPRVLSGRCETPADVASALREAGL